LKINVEDVLHIKDIFPTLSPNKIIDINNIINKSNIFKLKINMAMKEPSRKQIIVLMSKSNVEVILNQANFLIININRHLKEAKSNIITDFIHLENDGVILTIFQAVFAQDMSIIKKCVKEINNINSKHIDTPQLPKLKLYLKILGLSYILENTNLLN